MANSIIAFAFCMIRYPFLIGKPMRHYRIVKKSTHYLIAISALAVFFNATLLGAAALGLMQVSKPEKTEAACSSGTAVSIGLVDTNTNKQINKPFTVMIKSSDAGASGRHYKYQFYIKDKATNFVEARTDEMGSFLGTDMSEDFADLTITGTGPKEVYAVYSQGLTAGATDSDPHCADWPSTNVIEIVGVDSAIDSPNVVFTSVPEKTEKTGTVDIGFKITGATGKTASIDISAGGDCSNKPVTNTSCWYWKVDYLSLPDPAEYTYSWVTSLDTDIGRHGITIRVYEDEAKTRLTDTKTAYTTICAPGAIATCVADNGNPGTTTGDTDTGLEAPGDTMIYNPVTKFASAFKLPTKITGAGDLVNVILRLIEYLLGVFAFIGLIISGIQYISSGGDPAKAEKAKKNVTYCVIGILVAVLAIVIHGIIVNFWTKGPI